MGGTMKTGVHEEVLLSSADEAAIRAIVGRLESAWNDADGAGYGEPFAEDAWFVPIFGDVIRGRAAIAAGHRHIFETVYRGSRNAGAVEELRGIAPGVALAQVVWTLRIPQGDDMREARARNTIVLANGAAGWQIAAFQNTLIATPGAVGLSMPRP